MTTNEIDSIINIHLQTCILLRANKQIFFLSGWTILVTTTKYVRDGRYAR